MLANQAFLYIHRFPWAQSVLSRETPQP